MKVQTSGELRRVDVTPLLELLPALRREWDDVRFDASGHAINPLTGDATAAFSLLDGRHRRTGARYRIVVTSPNLDDVGESTRPDPRQQHGDGRHPRRRGDGAPDEPHQDHVTLTLLQDDAPRFAISASDALGHWAVAADVDRAELPRIGLAGWLDLTAALRESGAPGFLSALLGGTGDATAVLDLGAIEAGGRIAEAEGRANRFRGGARLDVRPTATTWALAGAGTLRARGLGRPVLWFVGRRVRRSVERWLEELWATAGSRMSELEREMSRLRAAIDAEGGAQPFVRRALWDRSFDPGVPWLIEHPRPDHDRLGT